MRLCVTCIYWTLLLVSVVSSGLLFLIVASEGTQISDKPIEISQQEVLPKEDVSKDTENSYSAVVDNKIPDVRPRPTVNTEQEQAHATESVKRLSSSETIDSDPESETKLDVLKQGLTPQPNLSQGISETGQAVVLTLVDTAAAELQSLAEPRLSSEPRSRASSKNVTLRTSKTTAGSISATTVPPSSATSFEATKHEGASTESTGNESFPGTTDSSILETASNATKFLSSNEETRIDEDNASNRRVGGVETKDDVVIVRAEQKPLENDEPATTRKAEDSKQLDETKDGAVKHAENLTATPELDDGGTRAKLVVGGEESPAVILDGLVPTGLTDHQHQHHEDMPSFSEWAQKRLEEAEKKKSHPNASIQNPGGPGRGLGGLKVRSKNYASPDCGAKIVAVNPEARSARSVLVSTRDEYMLNTCTSRIWFVVELCEAIQAKKIELANFELFSSSPKNFSVYVSDRFPTRDWSPVGQFAARDQRDIQSFHLSPQLFGKFIKVELHSHYGSEHFCPISLFRAYGTSEFEVLETETDHRVSEATEDEDEETSERNDEDEDEALDAEVTDAETRNLFGSARDAVIRIVKKAAEVLVKTGDPSNKNNITKIQESIVDSITNNSFATCMTPRYTINCANCTDSRFARVFELLNCRASHLDDILHVPFVNETLSRGGLCSSYGFDSLVKNDRDDFARTTRNATHEPIKHQLSRGVQSRLNFLATIYSPEYILALCNVIATKERRLVLNTSYESSNQSSMNASTRIDAEIGKFETPEAHGQPKVPSITPTTTMNSCNPEIEGSCKESGAIETSVPNPQAANPSQQETPTSNSPNTTTTADTTTSSSIGSATSSVRSENAVSQTQTREDTKKESSPSTSEQTKSTNDETLQAEVLTTLPRVPNIATATNGVVEESQPVQSHPVDSTNGGSNQVVAPVASRERQDILGGQEINDNGTPLRQDHNNEQESGKPLNDGNNNFEQEAKLMAQDHISLDSILSELKDLEGEANIHANANQNANVVAQPTASSTPQQKESVFLRLSNRIKALERNMSLSGQYLEELSKRYKKQVEEMQRSLERATSAMSEESRKGEERELRRIEEISVLREEITSLTQSLEILLYDRNSWRSKLSTVCQHFVLVIVEIVVFAFVVSYCRRNSEFEDVEEETEVTTTLRNEVARRRSAASCGGTKKTRKRRPSEIAARIGGTYRDLMIDDRLSQESNKRKEKKKRRKKESTGGQGGVNGEMRNETSSHAEANAPVALTSRRSSSSDPVRHAKQLQLCHSRKRPDSAPEYTGLWNDRNETMLGSENSKDATFIEAANSRLPSPNPPNATNFTSHKRQRESPDDKEQGKSTRLSLFRGSSGGGGILKTKLSSPSFMKTALGSRSKRIATKQSANTKENAGAQTTKPEDWDWYSRNSSNRSDSGSPSSLLVDAANREIAVNNGQDNLATRNGPRLGTESESGDSSNNTPTVAKKDKKTGRSLRKMVRKFF